MQKEKVCFCIEHFFFNSFTIFTDIFLMYAIFFFFCVVQITRNYFAFFWMSSIIFSKMCFFFCWFFFLNLPTNFILIFSCQLTISCISFWMMKPITSRIKWYPRMRSADTAANSSQMNAELTYEREKEKKNAICLRHIFITSLKPPEQFTKAINLDFNKAYHWLILELLLSLHLQFYYWIELNWIH